MSPKKALLILLVILALFAAGFSFFYYSNKMADKSDSNKGKIEDPAGKGTEKASEQELKGIIEKINSNAGLTKEEEAAISQVIEEKAEKKVEEIGKAAENREYTQEEMNILFNPESTVEKELGIKEKTALPSGRQEKYTEEEADIMFNPEPEPEPVID